MGAAASIAEVEASKPSDASDVETLDDARAEIARMRRLFSLMASSKGTPEATALSICTYHDVLSEAIGRVAEREGGAGEAQLLHGVGGAQRERTPTDVDGRRPQSRTSQSSAAGRWQSAAAQVLRSSKNLTAASFGG